MNIHQILPNLSIGDAVGNFVFDLQALFEKWGHDSKIFVQTADRKLQNRVFKIHEFDTSRSEKTICIYHFSIGAGLKEFLKELKCKKIVINHNITPPSYMRGLNDFAEHMINIGLAELSEIVKDADLVLCDSEFNRRQVLDMGCSNTKILPVFINFERLKISTSRSLEEILSSNHVNILHVGRVVPNKRIEDIIKIFYLYKNRINKDSSLFIVGQYKDMGVDGYHQRLLELQDKLSLQDIYYTGKIGQDELNTYYKCSDVYLSMSEHEGFCIPLIESMFFDLPILALNTTAIPYTLDGAGILINEKNYSEIARIIDLIVKDETFKKKIIESQQSRLNRYMDFDFEDTIKGYITGLANGEY